MWKLLWKNTYNVNRIESFQYTPPPPLKEHNNKNKLYLLFDKKMEDSEKKEEKELDIEEDFREKAKNSPTTSTNDILN